MLSTPEYFEGYQAGLIYAKYLLKEGYTSVDMTVLIQSRICAMEEQINKMKESHVQLPKLP